MAAVSALGSSDETTNGVKLMRLIIDLGTKALRKTFTTLCPGNLQNILCTHQPTLSWLKHIKIINQNQWNKLYPAGQPNINDFDITLLLILLRNICGLSPPHSSRWDNKPNVSDHSTEADIVRIRFFRNERFAHIPNTSVSDTDFHTFWAEISAPLVHLGVNQTEINRLKNESCGKEEVERVLREWNKCESDIMTALEENRTALSNIADNVKILVNKEEDSSSDDVLNKHLVWCDFQKDIEMHYEKFTEGTREWVFESFWNWFNDETSMNRAFVISGLTGMGKSVIAAVICKRYAEHVGSSHFFQYNNSHYDNPCIFLQSLAWRLCKVIPEYKEALIRKLSCNLGQSLNNMDVAGLFSVLFKEPFSGISYCGKHLLVVLDAIDECEYSGRYALANLIPNHLPKLPSFIRFVITMRPEKNLIDKFRELNPFVIEGKDERNVDDVKLVLKKKISTACVPSADLVDSLAEKSDGLMLYAFCVSEIYKDKPSVCKLDDLPKSIENYYEMCLQRLENELKVGTKISRDDFFIFLNALAVAKEPLPRALVESLFDFKNSPTRKQQVRKCINALSSLFEIKEDKSISFFHKSVRDWLVDSPEHDYSVDVQHGHQSLFNHCIRQLDQLKNTRFSNSRTRTNAAFEYSIKYWMLHLLNGLKDPDKADCFVNNYVADLDVIFASVCVDVDLTLNNIIDLKKDELYRHVSEDTRATVDRLFSLIRKFASLLRDHPQTFLQNVVNEGGEELSLKATALLKTRYKDIFYLEFQEKEKKNEALKARCVVSGTISGIDISPEQDYVVCSYKEGGIELFSLTTFKSEWKIQDFMVKVPSFPSMPDCIGNPFMFPHCIVFHPSEKLILPGRLNEVLTLQRKFTTGPFQADSDCGQFTNCCFSKDNSRMVTYYGNNLLVWNVSTGTKEKCISCKKLFSFSYTVSGKFLGTVDIENVFNVYDTENDYNVKSASFCSQFPVEIVSTVEQNSWLCSLQHRLIIMNNDFYFCRCEGSSVCEIVLPSNFYYCELQCFLQRPDLSWFSKVKKILNDTFGWSRFTAIRYTLMRNESVLVYSCSSNAMHIFSIEELASAEDPKTNMKGVFSTISRKGDFAYFNNTWAQTFSICELDSKKKYSKPSKQHSQMDFAVVRDGVVLYGDNDALELWNSKLTKRLAVFDELAGSKRYLQVSDELIACVYQSRVTFFNIVTEEIEREVTFDEDIWSVYACSIKYDVFAQMKSGKLSLWKDGKKVDGWEDVFRESTSLRSVLWIVFSPGGSRLALCSAEINNVFVFDVAYLRLLAQISIYGPYNDILRLQFFDNETLLCSSTNHILYLINAERGEILTCLDVGDIPAPICVCRKRSIVFVGLNCSEHFELINVWLPRELPLC